MKIIYNRLIIAFIFCIAILFGCRGVKESDLHKDKVYSGEKAEKETETVKKSAETKTEDISNSAESIRTLAEETLQSKPPINPKASENQKEIVLEANRIEAVVPTLNRDISELAGILRRELEFVKKQNSAILTEAERMQKDFTKEMEKSADEKEELLNQLKQKDEQIEQIHKSMLYKILAGFILLFVGSVPVFIWANPKAGVAMAISGLVGAALTLFLIKFLTILSVVLGILVLLGIVGFVIYSVKNKKTTEELVNSFEFIKKKDKWDADEKSTVALIQSQSTKKLVEEIKAKL